MADKQYYLVANDGYNNIYAVEWIPSNTASAAVVLVHGMTEHMGRYEDFAQTLAKEGYHVFGTDLLGHGRTVKDKADLGYIGEPDGNAQLIQNIDIHIEYIKKHYPELPLIIMGHSMGSFLVRQYISTHGNKLNGAIISGTGQVNKGILKIALILSKIIIGLKGEKYKSTIFNNTIFDYYQTRIKNANTKYDWLSKDYKSVRAYIEDPLCGFVFSMNGYVSLFKAILLAENTKIADSIPKDLPMLFISGDDDPVGGYGKGVMKAAEMYRKANIKNIKCKLYKSDRHELINEMDRVIVFSDIMDWIDEIVC